MEPNQRDYVQCIKLTQETVIKYFFYIFDIVSRLLLSPCDKLSDLKQQKCFRKSCLLA